MTDHNIHADLPATVYVKSSRSNRVFHADRDCRYCPENVREWDAKTALDWLSACRHCAVDEDSDGAGPNSSNDIYRTLCTIGEERNSDEESDHGLDPAIGDD